MKITSYRSLANGWKDFLVGNFRVCMLNFNEPSQWGINGGRISKLWIKDTRTNKVVCNFDRGWDVEPGSSVMNAYNNIIAQYN